VVLFGLSMDYHVFILSRVREAAESGMPTDRAVSHAIKATAGVVSAAAVVMVSVFSIFATLGAIEFKQFGVALGVAVLVDATIVRARRVVCVTGRADSRSNRGSHGRKSALEGDDCRMTAGRAVASRVPSRAARRCAQRVRSRSTDVEHRSSPRHAGLSDRVHVHRPAAGQRGGHRLPSAYADRAA
jgi:hypothetical protein